MSYFVGTEKTIMVDYSEVEVLEIENDILFIYFKSGNIAKLKVDIKNVTEMIKYDDKNYSKQYFLSNKKDIDTYNLLIELRNEKYYLEKENRKITEVSGRMFDSFDYEGMSDEDKKRYNEIIDLVKNSKYSFQE